MHPKVTAGHTGQAVRGLTGKGNCEVRLRTLRRCSQRRKSTSHADSGCLHTVLRLGNTQVDRTCSSPVLGLILWSFVQDDDAVAVVVAAPVDTDVMPADVADAAVDIVAIAVAAAAGNTVTGGSNAVAAVAVGAVVIKGNSVTDVAVKTVVDAAADIQRRACRDHFLFEDVVRLFFDCQRWQHGKGSLLYVFIIGAHAIVSSPDASCEWRENVTLLFRRGYGGKRLKGWILTESGQVTSSIVEVNHSEGVGRLLCLTPMLSSKVGELGLQHFRLGDWNTCPHLPSNENPHRDPLFIAFLGLKL